MGSGEPAGRARCWQRWQAGRDPSAPRRPPSSIAKDLLGAAMTLAIIGAIVLQATNRLAIPCSAGRDPRTGPGACSGASAPPHQAAGPCPFSPTPAAARAGGPFVGKFFGGKKGGGRGGGNRDAA